MGDDTVQQLRTVLIRRMQSHIADASDVDDLIAAVRAEHARETADYGAGLAEERRQRNRPITDVCRHGCYGGCIICGQPRTR